MQMSDLYSTHTGVCDGIRKGICSNTLQELHLTGRQVQATQCFLCLGVTYCKCWYQCGNEPQHEELKTVITDQQSAVQQCSSIK